MKFKELLKEFAKSVKKGKIHKLLRLLMVGLFLYLGVVVGRELLTYYIEKRKEIYFSVAGLKWDFSFKKGELALKFSSLDVETPSTSLSAEKGGVVFELYDSLLNLRPHFKEVKVERVAAVSKGGGKGKFSLPPIIVDRAEVGELLYEKGDLRVSARQILKNQRELSVGGVIAEKGQKRIAVLPFRGYLKKGYYHIPLVTVSYGSSLLSGSLKVSEGLREGEFDGFLSSPSADLNLSIKVYGKKINSKGEGKVIGKPTSFSLSGSLDGEIFKIKELQGKWNGLNFDLKGELEREEFSLEGRYWANLFKEGEYEIRGLEGKIKGSGSYSAPKLFSAFRAGLLSTGLADLKDLSGEGRFSLGGGELSFKAKDLEGRVKYRDRGKEIKGELRLENFSLASLKPVSRAVKRYGSWIPEAVLTGPFEFSYGKRELSYRGEFRVNRFLFKDFVASGGFRLKGNKSSASFSLGLSGSKGVLEGSGVLDISKKRIDSVFKGSSVELSSFDFLRRAGLEGRVSGQGWVRGDLKSPIARFDFSSDSLKVKGVSLSPVKGELLFENMAVKISAQSSLGVNLSELYYDVKKGRLSIKGSAREFPAQDLQKILAGYRVKLPFSLKGSLMGEFSINLSLKGKPVEVSVFSRVGNFKGEFVYGDLLRVSTGSSKGEVVYRNGELRSSFAGDIERGTFKGVGFSGGTYSLEVEGKEISARYSGVFLNLPQVDRVASSGEVKIGLENQEIGGSFGFRFSLKREFFEGRGEVEAAVEGSFADFTVKISGKGRLKSPYLKKEVDLKVEGRAEEPKNIGNVRIYGEGTDLRLLLFGKEANLVGKVRNVEFRAPKAEGRVNLAFVNLRLPKGEGSVSIPTFTVKPYGFYKLYSPTGVYINIEGSRVSVSDFSLSYVDGWIEFKEIGLEPVKGKFEGELGAKGLVYLLKLNKTIPFARNAIKVKGEFNYDRELSYRAEAVGDGVVLKIRYILDRVIVNALRAEVRNGELLKLNGELSAGEGTVLITKEGEAVSVALSQVPIGAVDEWKSLVSGNLNADIKKRKVKGSLELSRTKLYFKKKEKEEEVLLEQEEEEKLPIKLDIGVLFDEPVKIKGELFWIEILPNLKVITLNERPVIAGNFYATNGEIDYMGKKFKVLYGSGTIEDLKRKKGRVSILASAHISGYYVYMKIEGPLTSPTIYLTSDPPLTREEIMNLIMTGASPEQIEASSEIFPAVQIAYYAASSFFKPIESKFQKVLGLESFTVEPYITKYGETVAKLTITKRLTERIKLIGYGTTGQNPEYGGSIDLYLTDKYYLELRYNSYYKTEAGIGFEVNLR